MYSYFQTLVNSGYMHPRTLPKYTYMVIAFTQWQQHINFVYGYSLLKTGREKETDRKHYGGYQRFISKNVPKY